LVFYAGVLSDDKYPLIRLIAAGFVSSRKSGLAVLLSLKESTVRLAPQIHLLEFYGVHIRALIVRRQEYINK
jgi:hypothetical protein